MWDKLGVNWHSNHRGEHAQMFSTARAFTEHERREIFRWMNETYEIFKQRVAEGRGNRIRGDLESLAGGRVYTGSQALGMDVTQAVAIIGVLFLFRVVVGAVGGWLAWDLGRLVARRLARA